MIPSLEAMPVVPTDQLLDTIETLPEKPTQDLIAQALLDRPELAESDIDLAEPRNHPQGRAQRTVADALSGRFLWQAPDWPAISIRSITRPESARRCPPTGSAAFENAWNDSSPDYFVGLNLNIPIRNRVAKADQYRSELEYRQAELREQQLRKQIRIEVRNAEYALEQGRARVRPPGRRVTSPRRPSTSCRKSRSWARARTSRR